MKAVFCYLALAVSVLADDPLLGILKHGDVHEMTVIYQQPVEPNSALDLQNYRISIGALTASRLSATNQGVTLTASGLFEVVSGALNITNVFDTALNPLPDFHLNFDVTNRFWTAIGGNELNFEPSANACAVSTNGFDLFSGGIQQSEEYDEAVFAGEPITGDFDRRVRVEWVDPAGFNAKAGIMIRESLDVNKARPLNPDDPAQGFSRYIELAVSAAQTADHTAGSGGHQIWMRDKNGAQFTSSVTVTNDAPPAFPDAWLRVQRVGDEFKMFRGTNGVTWEQIGSAQFPDATPTNIFVGVAFSPQNNDLSFGSGLRSVFTAKFRNYGGTNTPSLKIAIEKTSTTQAELSWIGNGILQTASPLPTNNAAWTDATNQQNPQTINLNEPSRFFRLRSSN
jgi:hypothetical protein